MDFDDFDADEPAPVATADFALTSDDYRAAHGEALCDTLDLDTWRPSVDWMEMYDRLRREVADAVHQEADIYAQIREHIFPLLRTPARRLLAPACTR